MDAARHHDLSQTIAREAGLVRRFLQLQQAFRATWVRPERHPPCDPTAWAARQDALQQLVAQTQALQTELQAIHRAYHCAYPT